VSPGPLDYRIHVRLPDQFRQAGNHIEIALPGGIALFTTRRGGVSEGAYASLNLGLWTDDDPDAVRANRELVAARSGRLAQGRQVHGAHVHRVTSAENAEPAPADGQATALPGVAPIVLVADCLPVALIAPGAVAMVHAGWRGLADGVIAEGVRALHDLGVRGAVAAAIGPGAGVCCYETGDEVHAAFARFGPAARQGRHADLKAVARAQLVDAGVDEIHDVGLCTMCAGDDLFFSHRRDGGVTGRQAGVAWRS
jgi:YfiH family protein